MRCCLMFFMGGISICSILPLLPSTPKSALNFFSIRNHGVWHCFVPLQPAYAPRLSRGACGSPKVYLKTKKMTDISQTQAGFCVCRISKAAFSCFACAGKRCAAVSRKSRERYVSFLFIVRYPFFLYPQSQQGPPEARVYCRTKSVTPPASLMV